MSQQLAVPIYDPLTTEGIEKLVSLAKDKLPQSVVKGILREHDLPHSGNWDTLLKRVESAIANGDIQPHCFYEEVVSSESYSKHCIYCYQIDHFSLDIDTLKQEVLEEFKPSFSINSIAPSFAQPRKRLVHIISKDRFIDLRWIHIHSYWDKQSEDYDLEADGVETLTRKFKKKRVRHCTSVKINLAQKIILIRIPVDKGVDKEDEIAWVFKKIHFLQDKISYSLRNLHNALQNINDSSNVLTRQNKYRSTNHSTGSFTSPSKKHHINENSWIKNMSKDLVNTSAVIYGNYYWKYAANENKKDTRFTIKLPNQVTFPSSVDEKDASLILGRVFSINRA